MRFMTIVKSAETSAPPPQGLIDAIGKLGQEAASKGVMVEMGGLLPTAMGGRVRLAGGRLTVTDSPFTEAKEVVGGYAVYAVRSKAEALEWAKRFMALHQEHWKDWEGEVEVRQLYDPPGGPPA
jgi:hypothetical protein